MASRKQDVALTRKHGRRFHTGKAIRCHVAHSRERKSRHGIAVDLNLSKTSHFRLAAKWSRVWQTRFCFSAREARRVCRWVFWHRHPGCKFAYTPKSRPEFWQRKFDSNVRRDKIVTRELRNCGWRTLRVWECELHQKYWPKIARRIVRLLKRG